MTIFADSSSLFELISASFVFLLQSYREAESTSLIQFALQTDKELFELFLVSLKLIAA